MITKQELQKLLDNADENKLNIYKIDFFVLGDANAVECIKSILECCQKEPSLHDELLKIGYKKYHYSDRYTSEKDNGTSIIVDENYLSYYLNVPLSQINNIKKFNIKQIIACIKNMENLVNDMEDNNG